MSVSAQYRTLQWPISKTPTRCRKAPACVGRAARWLGVPTTGWTARATPSLSKSGQAQLTIWPFCEYKVSCTCALTSYFMPVKVQYRTLQWPISKTPTRSRKAPACVGRAARWLGFRQRWTGSCHAITLEIRPSTTDHLAIPSMHRSYFLLHAGKSTIPHSPMANLEDALPVPEGAGVCRSSTAGPSSRDLLDGSSALRHSRNPTKHN